MPYNETRTNHVENDLLLRSDVHDLFNLFLISIDTKNFRVRVSQSLKGSEYALFDGRPVRLPTGGKVRPSLKALNWHFAQFIH